jgi:hypothetical protein
MEPKTTSTKSTPKKGSGTRFEQIGSGEKVLETAKYFRVIFLDGEEWECKLLHTFAYDLLLEKEDGGIALVPKHSVRYYELNKKPVNPEV